MSQHVIADKPATVSARDLAVALSKYRTPNVKRSLLEIAITLLPFLAFWGLAYAALAVSYLLTLALVVPAALFLLRLFMIQHDCGHGSFLPGRAANDWLGRAIGILTLTPYDVWKRSHAVHHATTGHLGQRGTGDIDTLTVAEYCALPLWRRLRYRLYRHPLVMFGLGPGMLFLVQHRFPIGHWRSGVKYWVSAMATNVGIAALVGGMMYLIGVGPFLLVHLPIVLLAASIGVWLFYIQHQFDGTYWADASTWNVHDAGLYGSSYYDLPGPLPWFTANIGLHHIHHTNSRIPYYHLPLVLRDYPQLGKIQKLTIRQSLSCTRLRLWDEKTRRLVTFEEAWRSRPVTA